MVEWSDAQTAPSAAKPVYFNTSAGSSSDMWSFWPIHWNPGFTHVLSQNSHLLNKARNKSSFGTLCGQLSNYAEIHASL